MRLDSAKLIEFANADGPPRIEIIRGRAVGHRLGVFASSFNPPTIAHVELIQRAAETFSLDSILALAGQTNADKSGYECSLEDRLAMLVLAVGGEPRVSIGVSSHPFYVDMIDALKQKYPAQTDLHFIVGFDTFERVLDSQERYTKKYYREFKVRADALDYLFAHSSLIVAGRAGAGLQSVTRLIESESAVPLDRVFYLDFPADLGELSATEVRKLRRTGQPIERLVPSTVEQYIKEHRLYLS